MKKKSGVGLPTQKKMSPENLGRALAFSRIGDDLANAGVVVIRANARLVAGGVDGVLWFMPGASVGEDGELVLPTERT